MRNNFFPHLLLGKSFRKDRGQRIVETIENQEDFDELFNLLFHPEYILVHRTMHAVRNVIAVRPEYLQSHKGQLLNILMSGDHEGIKRFAIKLISEITLTYEELKNVWNVLRYQALNPNENRIIRTEALKSLYDITIRYDHLKGSLLAIVQRVAVTSMPLMRAKARKLMIMLTGNTGNS